MREILFRGKRKQNNRWIEGSYQHYRNFRGEDQHLITYINGNGNDIFPETVGQYTGLTDKNGTKIFEGDVVWWCGIVGTIVWQGHKFCIKSSLIWDFASDDKLEVVGNVYDNPELLKDGADNA